MAGSVNKVIILGNLGKDPEMRSTQDGRQIANLSVATAEAWKDRISGERKEKVEWHRVVIFSEGLAQVAADYLKKGSKVYLEGQLQTRKWTDQQGVDKYSTEVVLQGYDAKLVLLDSKRDDHPKQEAEQRQDRDRAEPQAPMHNLIDDEIPF